MGLTIPSPLPYNDRQEVIPMTNEEKILEMLGSMQADIKTIKSDVQSLQSDVQGLQSDVQGLQSDVRTIQVDVAEMKESLEEVRTTTNVLVDWAERAISKMKPDLPELIEFRKIE